MSGATQPATATPTCRGCGTVLEPIAAATTSATHGTVAGAPLGPVGWRCPRRSDEGDADHDLLVPAEGDVASALATGLVVARRTRLRSTLRCGECDTPFSLPGRRTTRTITVTGAVPAVTLALDVPMLRCTEDAVDNVPPEAVDDAAVVIDSLIGDGS